MLNLPSYIVKLLKEAEHDYQIETETKDHPNKCPHCKSANLVGFGHRRQMIKDLPMHGKHVGINVDTKRFQCKSCNKTFYESLPDVDVKRLMTNRLVSWIGKQAVRRTFASISEDVGINEATVRLVFRDYVNELERTVRFETPKWLGIDEIHLIKPRSVISNIKSNTIVELLPNRDKDAVINYLSQLDDHEHILYVAMDMWAPLKDAIEVALPQAKIIIDRHHVVKMVNEALDRFRKIFRLSLTPKQRRGLMHDRVVLLKRESDLNDKEALTLSGWLNKYPELGSAYRLKEEFFKIYDATSKEAALAKYTSWEKSIAPEVIDSFSDLISAWHNWQPYILNYFDRDNGKDTELAEENCSLTSGYTESLNNLNGIINRLGRGYSFEALRAKVLFAEGALKKQIIKSLAEGKETVVHYGVDISTLIEMIESGHI